MYIGVFVFSRTYMHYVSVGDTDGLYKNKRYFKVADNYGKFVRITRVTSVLDKQVNLLRKYQYSRNLVRLLIGLSCRASFRKLPV